MIFGIWEWVRVTCYVIGIPAAVYLAFRFGHRHETSFSMLLAGLACLFSWYLIDLTLVATGMSSRDMRNLATPLTVFTSGSLIAMTFREVRLHRLEKRIRNLGATSTDLEESSSHAYNS